MLPGPGDAVPFIVAFFVPLAIVLALTPYYSKFLASRNRVGVDVHKKERPLVPTPAGPLLVAALVAGELLVLAFYGSIIPVAIIGVLLIAVAIGLLDDLRTLGGKTKPLLMLLAAVPILLAEYFDNTVYDSVLYFPLFGSTGTHFIIFGIIVLASIPVLGNAFNMMDAFNGEIAGFTVIAAAAMVVALVLRAAYMPDYSPERVAVALPLVAVPLAFYFFNRYPSKIFDGDSGSLPLGAMYGAIAFIGGVEFAAIVAVIPAVLNAFYILSSVKKVIEHKKMTARPTFLGEEGRLHATDNPEAPATLVRMLLLDGPLTEREIVKKVLILTGFAAVLSVITSLLTWVV